MSDNVPHHPVHGDGRTQTPVHIEAARYDAAVFDLDGVITTTVQQHARAWKRLFDEFLRAWAEQTGEHGEPFDIEADYLRLVDGKPRYDGVQAFLSTRGIVLPRGDPSDTPGFTSVCSLGNEKDAHFTELLALEGAHVYESSVQFIDGVRRAGCLTALISASRNAIEVIETAGVADRFDALVDGVRTEWLGLKGKPAPDVFLRALSDLGVSPERAVAFEDASAGVAAARDAGFALVVGVERSGTPGRLLKEGAHTEVTDLGELMLTGRSRPRPAHALPWAFDAFEPILSRARGRRLAVFIDYDGTLTPIVARPDLARLTDEMRGTVRQLAERALVAIVSGRDLDDVMSKVGIDGVAYAGCHGIQLRDASGHEEVAAEAESYRADLNAAAERLDRDLGVFPGTIVERKGFAIAAHYRQVAESDAGSVRARVHEVAAAFPRLRITGGKKVLELRPDLNIDKGQLIRMLADRWGGQSVFPVYLGDDQTDEDAFQALRGRGAGIIVGDSPQTDALYRLRDIDEVGRWLGELDKRLAD